MSKTWQAVASIIMKIIYPLFICIFYALHSKFIEAKILNSNREYLIDAKKT